MQKVIIPKQMVQDDLVILPRAEYEELLRAQPAATPNEDEKDEDVEAAIAEGLADIEAGRVSGPFETHDELMHHLRKQEA